MEAWHRPGSKEAAVLQEPSSVWSIWMALESLLLILLLLLIPFQIHQNSVTTLKTSTSLSCCSKS